MVKMSSLAKSQSFIKFQEEFTSNIKKSDSFSLKLCQEDIEEASQWLNEKQFEVDSAQTTPQDDEHPWDIIEYTFTPLTPKITIF